MAEAAPDSEAARLRAIARLAHDLANRLVAAGARLEALVAVAGAEQVVHDAFAELRAGRDLLSEIRRLASGEAGARSDAAAILARAAQARGVELRFDGAAAPPAAVPAALLEAIARSICRIEAGHELRGAAEANGGGARLRLVSTAAAATDEERERIFALGHGASDETPSIAAVADVLGRIGGRLVLEVDAGRRAWRIDLPAAAIAPASRVLLVDDDASVRRAMTILLESFGCAVEEAASLADCEALLERLGSALPDAAIVDLRLAGERGGVEVLALLERHGVRRRLVLTGDASGPLAAEARRRAGVLVLEKPADPPLLRQALGLARS